MVLLLFFWSLLNCSVGLPAKTVLCALGPSCFVFQFQNITNWFMYSSQKTKTQLHHYFLNLVTLKQTVNGGLMLPSFTKVCQNGIHHSKAIWKNRSLESYHHKLWHNYCIINACKAFVGSFLILFFFNLISFNCQN